VNRKTILVIVAVGGILALCQDLVAAADSASQPPKAAAEDPGVLLRYQAQQDVPYFISVISQVPPGVGLPSPAVSRGIVRVTVSPVDEGLPYFRGRQAAIATLDRSFRAMEAEPGWDPFPGWPLPAPYFDARGRTPKMSRIADYDEEKQKGGPRAFEVACLRATVAVDRADALARSLRGPDVSGEAREQLRRIVKPVRRQLDRFSGLFWGKASETMEAARFEDELADLQQEVAKLRQSAEAFFAKDEQVPEAVQADFDSFVDALEKLVGQLGKVKLVGKVRVSRMLPPALPFSVLRRYLLTVPVLPEERVRVGSEWVHTMHMSGKPGGSVAGFDIPVRHRIVHLHRLGDQEVAHIHYQGEGRFVIRLLTTGEIPWGTWEQEGWSRGMERFNKRVPADAWEQYVKTCWEVTIAIEGYAAFDVQRGRFVSNEGWFERIDKGGTAAMVRTYGQQRRRKIHTQMLLLDQDGGKRFPAREHLPGQPGQ